MTLPTSIVAGDVNHIAHHNTVHELVNLVAAPFTLPGIAHGVAASLPPAGTRDRLYWATDTQVLYVDIGTGWQTVSGVVNRGDWNSGLNYAVGDIVQAFGDSFIAIVPNASHVPPNSLYWTPLGPIIEQTTPPLPLGVASVGTPGTVSASNHVHPQQIVEYNVVDFGAKGDGATDDYVAFAAALAAAAASTGGVVLVPIQVTRANTVYMVSQKLVVPTQTALVGHGRGVTIKQTGGFPASTPVVQLGHGNDSVFGCRLENITLDCANGTGSIGVYSNGINEQSGVFRVLVQRFKSRGIKLENTGQFIGGYNIEDVELGVSLTAPAGAVCLEIVGTSGTVSCRELRGITANSYDGTTVVSNCIGFLFNNALVRAYDLHAEHMARGVDFGPSLACAGQINGGDWGPNLTEGVHIYNTGQNSIGLYSQRSAGGGTQTIVDAQSPLGIAFGPVTGVQIARWVLGEGTANLIPLDTSYQPVYSTWIAATLAGAWATFGNPYGAAAYRKDAYNMVHLRGVVAGGTGLIFTLPAGYRPAPNQQVLDTQWATTGLGALDVGSNGQVVADDARATYSLNGISFLAEQ